MGWVSGGGGIRERETIILVGWGPKAKPARIRARGRIQHVFG